MARLEGRRAVIVGGATGWGLAASGRLAIDGAEVVVVDSDAQACQAAAQAVGVHGTPARCITVDLASHEQLAEASLACGEDGRPVDILVTNHMVLDWASVEECDLASFERVVRHNLIGPVAAVKAFLPLLKRSGHGSIVLLGSIDGLYGNPRVPSYSASKGGYIPLTHVMATEFAQYNIRVNAVASGQTNQPDEGATDARAAESRPGWAGFPGPWYLQQLAEATPLKRHGSPAEWAGTIAFLASDDASYVTGSVIVVDCGRTGITAGTV